MKKILLTGIALGMMVSFASTATTLLTNTAELVVAMEDWKKDEDQAWAGKDGVWYKIDEKASLWWSKDGKKWEAVKDGKWQDKEGKWLQIKDKKLVWSADGGKTWAEVPEWKWEGTDGKWYKFDNKWTLWING